MIFAITRVRTVAFTGKKNFRDSIDTMISFVERISRVWRMCCCFGLAVCIHFDGKLLKT